MATKTHAGNLGSSMRVSADPGSALTATTTYHIFPQNIGYLEVEPFNFGGVDDVVEMAKIPYAIVLFTQDDLATAPTDFSEEIQDGDATANAIDAMDTEANGDFILFGTHAKFKGIRVLMADAEVNSNPTITMTVKYWNGSAWTDISATDGTASGGTTFAQDGNITWTVPSAWVQTSIQTAESLTPAQVALHPFYSPEMYWVKIEVSGALDASVDIEGMFAMSNETPIQFRAAREMTLRKKFGGYAGLELSAAGATTPTASVNINAHALDPHTELE